MASCLPIQQMLGALSHLAMNANAGHAARKKFRPVLQDSLQIHTNIQQQLQQQQQQSSWYALVCNSGASYFSAVQHEAQVTTDVAVHGMDRMRTLHCGWWVAWERWQHALTWHVMRESQHARIWYRYLPFTSKDSVLLLPNFPNEAHSLLYHRQRSCRTSGRTCCGPLF